MKIIKLSYKDLLVLYQAHADKEQPGTGPYYDLLREHCVDLCLFFEKLASRGHQNYRVKFSSLQALAFTQLWLDQPLPHYGIYTILNVLGQINKAHVDSGALRAARAFQRL